MTYAVIDIGTNTLLLLVAKAKKRPKKIVVIADRAIITRLGQGLTENHFFISEAMNRTLLALAGFKEICKTNKVKKIVAVGTAACRTAANVEVFIDRVREQLGIKIDVIKGDQEAEYAFAACWQDFGGKNKKLLAIDIGGGSTEIITGPVDAKKDRPKTVISLPLGSVRLTEQFVTTDPISTEGLNRLRVAVRNGLHDELEGFYGASFDPGELTMIATAGTATTLAAIDLNLKTYSAKKVHGYKLKKQNLERMLLRLISMTVKERQGLPGMEPLRADVILAGALLLHEALCYFKKEEVIISDHGIRYGIFWKKFVG